VPGRRKAKPCRKNATGGKGIPAAMVTHLVGAGDYARAGISLLFPAISTRPIVTPLSWSRHAITIREGGRSSACRPSPPRRKGAPDDLAALAVGHPQVRRSQHRLVQPDVGERGPQIGAELTDDRGEVAQDDRWDSRGRAAVGRVRGGLRRLGGHRSVPFSDHCAPARDAHHASSPVRGNSAGRKADPHRTSRSKCRRRPSLLCVHGVVMSTIYESFSRCFSLAASCSK
jgi:hypothetical protein